MYCVKCGAKLEEGATICPSCSAPAGAASGVVLYDYVTVEAEQATALETADCYERLGWELVERADRAIGGCTLRFKRDRKTPNKEKLVRLQTKLDDAIAGVQVLEKRKTSTATAAAVGIGVAGTLTFGGGMCLCLLQTAAAYLAVGCALGAVGIGVCALGYLAYRRISRKKTAEMNKRIDAKRDEISTLLTEAQQYR